MEFRRSKEVCNFIIGYGSIFPVYNIDHGKTSFVKHIIRLKGNSPFKKSYRCIPPSMYQEVHNHLKEMLEIGAKHAIVHGLVSSYLYGKKMGNSDSVSTCEN